ncbi:MAG: RraA family protein [Pseudonocardia sp.]|uniref:RraA family protein n=1 Tax=unclassified Pseudonocardia TaxID=2619320 RepID=UPI00086CF2BC|nr:MULTISPECIES: RraA family protein [unclassified Pseudonocardia]MBN9108352.1 RraA family protein [Pseudonocardia sp.]ODU30331.1 MAG: diguanylate cyclase [Pseudonocardia sp. SCN 72-51]ODV08728.1 MAG: diguanylate cyclase [Pseudonocardia sp. SCN 73-27]
MDAEATKKAVDQLSGLTTAAVSDALDKLGRAGAVPGIIPFDPSFRVCGPAYTGQYEPVDEQGGTVGDFIDDVDPGSVVVLSNDGRLDCTIWGDILTSVASRRGISGTVLHGVCRDVAASLEFRYPVLARGRNMQTGKDRVRLSATQVPVTLGSVTVHPGDLVLGDADGVVVIAAGEAEEVLAVAIAIEDAETAIREAAATGERLDEVRRRLGYHQLQTAAR